MVRPGKAPGYFTGRPPPEWVRVREPLRQQQQGEDQLRDASGSVPPAGADAGASAAGDGDDDVEAAIAAASVGGDELDEEARLVRAISHHAHLLSSHHPLFCTFRALAVSLTHARTHSPTHSLTHSHSLSFGFALLSCRSWFTTGVVSLERDRSKRYWSWCPTRTKPTCCQPSGGLGPLESRWTSLSPACCRVVATAPCQVTVCPACLSARGSGAVKGAATAHQARPLLLLFRGLFCRGVRSSAVETGSSSVDGGGVRDWVAMLVDPALCLPLSS